MNLNEEQKQAVEHGDGCCIVTSVPGSGKTTVLTSRVINLINRGVDPENILCLTFTNKAAEEMRQRVASQISGANKVWISTFHKMCVAILRKFGTKIGLDPDFTILIDTDQQDLLKKIARLNELELKSNEIYSLMSLANKYRENLIPFDDFVDEIYENPKGDEYVKIITEYVNTLRECNLVDFSGILYETYRVFTDSPEVVDTLSKKFKYVLIDEGQDENIIQYEIVKTIASKHGNLFVVADPAQCLYSWRGACPENLNKIQEDFPDCKNIILPKNYRSSEAILRAAQKLIRNNLISKDVVLECTRELEGEVSISHFKTPEEEADFVCRKIKTLRQKGTPYKECAVLYRTNSLSKVLEQKFRQHSIPYKMVGGYSFYDRKEVRDVIAYLNFLVNPSDSISFHRAISTPKKGIGDVAIGKLEKFCKENKKNLLDAIRNNLDEISVSDRTKTAFKKFAKMFDDAPANVFEAAKHFIVSSGYSEYLEKIPDEKMSDNKLSNVTELLNGIHQFSLQETSISEFLQYVSLQNVEEDESEECVKLSTIHAAKGLEWQCVWIISAEENMIPHYRSIIENDIDAERRLMYVAVTRAKNAVYISYCNTRKKIDFRSSRVVYTRTKPSRFLYELSENKYF